MSDDIKLPEPARWLSPGGMYAATRTVMPPANGDVAMYTAAQLRAAVLADRDERASAAEQVCYEAYQVVGSMLDDMGQFNTEQARKVLDNLSQAKKVHDDVLPWPSFRVQDAPSDAIRKGRRCVDRLDGYYDFECEGGPLRMNVEWDILKRSFEHLCRHIERAHGIVEKESGNESGWYLAQGEQP